MSQLSRTAVVAAACLLLLTPAAHAQKKGEVAYGTLKKIDTKGQRIMITAYDWDTLDIADTIYIYNVRTLETFNVENINEFKPGDDIEFEWMMHGNRKFISKISKGSMPIEEVELLWDPTVIPEDTDDTPPLIETVPEAEGGDAAETEPETADATVPETGGETPDVSAEPESVDETALPETPPAPEVAQPEDTSGTEAAESPAEEDTESAAPEAETPPEGQ